MLQWLMHKMRTKWIHNLTIFCYFSIILIPLWLAVDRLVWVAGYDVVGWFHAINENYISNGVLGFTVFQALLSTIITLLYGLPIAWQLGRYEWKFQSLIKSILTMPFVMPSIIAAIGFLQIIGNNGLDLRSNDSAMYTTLILAHAWFNLSLVIRFCEPVLSTLDPSLEDQLRLLPAGRSFYSRLRILWIPLLAPSIAAAACMTFVFSFTSFALVRWITVGENTLESMMAEIGSSAGINGYMIARNEIILSSSIIQFAILLVSLWIMSELQSRRNNVIPLKPETFVKKRNPIGWAIILPGLCFSILPLVMIFISSFRIRTVENGVSTLNWSTEGWSFAFTPTNVLPSASDALLNSLGYAFFTLLFALPLGWGLCNAIIHHEKVNPRFARFIDIMTLLPFAVSSVMIGLGVMLGMIRINPEFFYSSWFTPVIAHVMITTPFVVRILLPAMRSLDPIYDECGMTLGLSKVNRFVKIRLPLLKGSIIIASIFTIAMSLGEFGASWVVTRNSDWTTLPIIIDTFRGVPYDRTLTVPAANAIASILMLMALSVFTFTERFRKSEQGGMF